MTYTIYMDKKGNTNAENNITGIVSYRSTDAATVINNVISTLIEGDMIFMDKGKFKIYSSINLQNKTGIRITGSSFGNFEKGGTILIWAGATDSNLIDMRGTVHCTLENMNLSAGGIGSITGIVIDGNPTYNASQFDTFYNLTFFGFMKGIKICPGGSAQASENTLYSCRFYNCTTGVDINSSNAVNISFYSCEIQNAVTGILCTLGSFFVYGTTFTRNAIDINIIRSILTLISGAWTESSDKFLNVSTNSLGPVTVDTCSINCQGNGTDAITVGYLARDKGSLILRNLRVLGTGNINISRYFEANFIAEGILFQNGNFATLPKTAKLIGCSAKTENSGATLVGNGGTVTHGLVAIPKKVTCTPSVSGEMVSATVLTATTFTVAIIKNDGSIGNTQTIYWDAEV